MKKIIALILATLMMLSLAACGSSEKEANAPATTAAPAASFKAGFGKADITPTESVPMNGYASSSERMSTGMISYIYAIAVAVQDADGNIAVVCSVDNAATGEAIANEARSWATEKLGIPAENIVVSSIHQHSCPDPGNANEPSSGRYRTQLVTGIREAIRLAVEDLKPAEMYINTAETKALSFVRHYIANDPDGTIVGDNYNDAVGKEYGYKCHESESDKEMRLIKFTREEGNDIILVNFQAHPHMGTNSSDKNVHSDWPGVMRDTVNEKLGADCIYFSGAGGNLNSTSRISEENVSVDFRDHGKRAADYVVKAEDSYTKVETGKVACKEITVAYETDHSMDHLLPQAKIVTDARSRGTEEAYALIKNYPELHSIYHASAVVGKAAAGPTRDMTISVITFGDVAFTVHPYEMFDTNGMELRSGSVGNPNYDADDQLENPYAMTFICTMGNGTHGYVPSRLGFTNGGYSTDITKFAPGTGEQLVGDYLRLLNELHE